jgi:hypothetical protein
LTCPGTPRLEQRIGRITALVRKKMMIYNFARKYVKNNTEATIRK